MTGGGGLVAAAPATKYGVRQAARYSSFRFLKFPKVTVRYVH